MSERPERVLAGSSHVITGQLDNALTPHHQPATYYEDVNTSFSQKALRGPLQGSWAKTCDPVMTCYKLVSIEFKWYGLQTKMESYMHSVERDLFTKFHRELFCSMDNWHGLSMESIREMEKRTKEELVEKMAKPVDAIEPAK
ncbi:MAG: hypothetical protein JOS17DRAFT_789329 [Linnemannia elongata]|nr:MAG: hypothetical protein JOS17DRAFT_789329 [Linnemannia elongata]